MLSLEMGRVTRMASHPQARHLLTHHTLDAELSRRLASSVRAHRVTRHTLADDESQHEEQPSHGSANALTRHETQPSHGSANVLC